MFKAKQKMPPILINETILTRFVFPHFYGKMAVLEVLDLMEEIGVVGCRWWEHSISSVLAGAGKIPTIAIRIIFVTRKPLSKALSYKTNWSGQSPAAVLVLGLAQWSGSVWAGLLRLKGDYHCCSELSLGVQPKCYLCCNNAFRFPKTLRASLCYILFAGEHHWPMSCQNKDKCVILWAVQLMKPRSTQIWILCVYPFPECSFPFPNPHCPSYYCYRNTSFSLQWHFFPFLSPNPRPGAEPTLTVVGMEASGTLTVSELHVRFGQEACTHWMPG